MKLQIQIKQTSLLSNGYWRTDNVIETSLENLFDDLRPVIRTKIMTDDQLRAFVADVVKTTKNLPYDHNCVSRYIPLSADKCVDIDIQYDDDELPDDMENPEIGLYWMVVEVDADGNWVTRRKCRADTDGYFENETLHAFTSVEEAIMQICEWHEYSFLVEDWDFETLWGLMPTKHTRWWKEVLRYNQSLHRGKDSVR